MRSNLEKCSFLSRRLGFIISKDKITVSNERVEAIIKAARPSNVSELRGYLGTLNYLRRFIPEFASVLSPFGTLLKGKAKWCWTADHEREFLNVRDILVKPLINVHFNEDVFPSMTRLVSCKSPNSAGTWGVTDRYQPDLSCLLNVALCWGFLSSLMPANP